jgi:hypothetical protein
MKFQFDLKEIVHLITDKDQQKRIVTGICIRETGNTYALSFNGTETWHYSFEIQKFNETRPAGFLPVLPSVDIKDLV